MRTVLVGLRTEKTTTGDALLQRRRFLCQVCFEKDDSDSGGMMPIDDFEVVFASSKPPAMIRAVVKGGKS